MKITLRKLPDRLPLFFASLVRLGGPPVSVLILFPQKSA
jgi:hypothetical protein